MVITEESDQIVQVVDHALDLLEQFHGDVAELGVTELGRRLNLHKNRVFRLLATLESRNYIQQNRATGDYRLGIRTLELGQNFIKQLRLVSQSRPILEALVKECNETSHVSIFRDHHIVCVDTVETDHAVRVFPRVGDRLPAYCTAAGKIQLAYLSNRELYDYMAGCELKKYTPNTITDREMLNSHLAKVAKQGYALDNEEFDAGVLGISSPIRDSRRRIVGSVSICVPANRFSAERMEKEFIPLIRGAALQLSAKIGNVREPRWPAVDRRHIVSRRQFLQLL